jgi:hypothetical protein
MNQNIKEISDSDLIQICKEIYIWRKTGDLKLDGLFKKFFDEHEKDFISNIRNCEDDLIIESHKRYEDMVKLLFISQPNMYISR